MSEQLVERKSEDIEIDLLDIFRKIIAIRKKLYKAAIVGLIIGVIVGLSIPKRYTVNVTLSPEMGSDKGSNGLSGLAASFLGGGTGVGSSVDALNASLSSDIVSSTPFLLELLSIKVSSNKGITLLSYLSSQSSPWWSYVVGLPGMIISEVKSWFNSENDKIVTNNTRLGILELTKEESQKIGILKKVITVSVDKKTAMTAIQVTLQDPQTAAIVADSVVKKLQKYIIDYRTSKVKEDCVYLEKLFDERRQEYYKAQKRYAHYIDSHDNLVLQSVRTEQERLQNDMNLSFQVYSQVANQLQVSRAKVQEEKPVFAIVEPAVVPLTPSNTGLKVYILLFMFLCVFCIVGWELIVKYYWNTLKSGVCPPQKHT